MPLNRDIPSHFLMGMSDRDYIMEVKVKGDDPLERMKLIMEMSFDLDPQKYKLYGVNMEENTLTTRRIIVVKTSHVEAS
jgi:hypothetical protein